MWHQSLEQEGGEKRKAWRSQMDLACLRDPAENSIAIYENRRPHVMSDFEGRIDNDPSES